MVIKAMVSKDKNGIDEVLDLDVLVEYLIRFGHSNATEPL